MALSFPLTLAQFADKLKVVQASPLMIPDARTYSQTAGGELIFAESDVRLWQGSVTIKAYSHQQAAEFQSMLHLLSSGAGSFLMTNKAKPGPLMDPLGSILGASTPVIATLNGNNRELTFSGLPAGYVLSPGDMFSFQYGSSPTRYALHQIVVGGTANGSGVSPSIEVMPFIRPGAAVGAAVKFIKPEFKAVIPPGKFDVGSSDIIFTTGISIDFKQTLR